MPAEGGYLDRCEEKKAGKPWTCRGAPEKGKRNCHLLKRLSPRPKREGLGADFRERREILREDTVNRGGEGLNWFEKAMADRIAPYRSLYPSSTKEKEEMLDYFCRAPRSPGGRNTGHRKGTSNCDKGTDENQEGSHKRPS